MYIKLSSVLKWGTAALLAALLGWALLRWLLPIAAPFLLAMLLALAIESPVKALCRRGWKREFASGVCTLLLLGLIISAGMWLLGRGIRELSQLSGALPRILQNLSALLTETRSRAGLYRSLAPEEISIWLDRAIAALGESFAAIPARLSERLVAFLSMAAAQTPGILLFTATCGIGVYFFSAALPNMQAYMDTHLPELWQRRRLLLGSNMRLTLGKYLRAQGILMLLSFCALFAGLLLLKTQGAFLISALVAFLDALPVLGAGLVLLPWSAAAFLMGSRGTALGLLILWAVISLLRSCLQAKLLGDQMGLPPLVTLISLYAGWYLAGVWGMVLFPMLAMLAKQLELPRRMKKERQS